MFYLWLVHDILSPVSVVQGGQRLLQVAAGRRDGGYDGGLGAAAQTVLQEPGQLGLPVGDMRSPVHQAGGHTT